MWKIKMNLYPTTLQGCTLNVKGMPLGQEGFLTKH
jgi:hypothetical protein